MATVRLEVRCCCHPENVWGTLELPEHYVERGKFVNVAVSVQRTMGTVIRHPFVRFEVDEVTVHQPVPQTYLALKKPHDVTIDDLRMLHTFRERPHG